MDEREQNRLRFVHMFSSPLTALKGAAALLRRRPNLLNDMSSQTLLQTMERAIERIEQASTLLNDHASYDERAVSLCIPAAALPGPHAAATRDPTHPPAGAGPQSINRATPLAPVQAARPGTILLVANDPAPPPFTDALHAAGYKLIVARTALECLDTARRIHPDLIALDLDLLQHDDVQLAQVLREDPETKAIPVTFLAAAPATLAALPPQAGTLLKAAEPLLALRTFQQAIAASRQSGDGVQTILIVDDEEDIRVLLALGLEQEGYRTVRLTSGTEALLRAQQQRFDLIILDLMLPDLDGFAVLGGLRARAQTALTPIILLSALDSPHEKVQGLQLGADDYMTKPFVPAELSARVRAAIRRSELEGSANPSTRLPGNLVIERVIGRRIEQGQPFAVCYCDLDNFKAYNDAYGFLKGDAVIHQTAYVLVTAVERCGNPDDFVGHIGGDDFVIVTTPELIGVVCEQALHNFDALAPLFYDAGARALGYIESTDRRGRPERFPLVSLSISVVTNQHQPINHLAEVAQRQIDLKKRAKAQPGSVYLVDE